MAAISTILAATAATAAIAGTATSVYGASKASAANAASSHTQEMTAGWQSYATGIQQQALGVQTAQQELQISTQRKAIEMQQQQDDLRRQAANLDAGRRTRESIRQGIVARGQSLTAATHQGGGDTGSSAVGGAEGSISGRTGNNLMGIFSNLQIGNQIFDINKAISANYIAAQDENAGFVRQSQALQSQIIGVQKNIYDLGGQTALNSRDAAAAGTISAFGSGLSSLGGAIVKNQDAMSNMGTYFASAFGPQNSADNYSGTGGWH